MIACCNSRCELVWYHSQCTPLPDNATTTRYCCDACEEDVSHMYCFCQAKTDEDLVYCTSQSDCLFKRSNTVPVPR